MADVSNAHSTGITPDENRVLVTDALSITARFFARVGYLQKTKAKAG